MPRAAGEVSLIYNLITSVPVFSLDNSSLLYNLNIPLCSVILLTQLNLDLLQNLRGVDVSALLGLSLRVWLGARAPA